MIVSPSGFIAASQSKHCDQVRLKKFLVNQRLKRSLNRGPSNRVFSEPCFFLICKTCKLQMILSPSSFIAASQSKHCDQVCLKTFLMNKRIKRSLATGPSYCVFSEPCFFKFVKLANFK